ncbi:MAG: rhodanese-like domain-containing protein [Algibacter sp.]|uniref:rhodanese-like domain-containing protein n=1 Tax=Algibacter sp. TaxID=1872428 RepID=UPI0026124B1F|nr:rhodanese-like domain-containing protein [Algibacter sp.]MDG1729681.1 rhodanese-like domain-containing protein [Algibacter sp.]MDG2178952.1 rhodanese-like domain-containing protein [Algibacter sp.]
MISFRLFLYTLLLVSITGCNQMKPQEGFTNVKPKLFNDLIVNNVQLIDVRTPEEYIENHIPNAININYFSDDFIADITKLDTTKPIYIYCRSGKRSKKSVIPFKEVGFTQIYNLEGGILNWTSKGLSTQSK